MVVACEIASAAHPVGAEEAAADGDHVDGGVADGGDAAGEEDRRKGEGGALCGVVGEDRESVCGDGDEGRVREAADDESRRP